jgi:transcriptional antiterminator RfaH
VEVLSGAFSDLVGLYDCATDDERVIILLDLLGRQTRVRIPVEAIRAYA